MVQFYQDRRETRSMNGQHNLDESELYKQKNQLSQVSQMANNDLLIEQEEKTLIA